MLRQSLIFLLIILSSAGCGTTLMPPKGIPGDRRDYLEAINTSWKEQLLSNLVKLHEGDSLAFLEMSKVSAEYTSNSNIGAQYTYGWGYQPIQGGLGWLPTNRTNSVNASVGTTYGLKPSLTFAPIKGENLQKIMMEPIPLAMVLKNLQAGWRAEHILPLMVESVNNLRIGSLEGKDYGDAKFKRFARLFDELRKKGVIRINMGEQKEEAETSVSKGATAKKSGKDKNQEGTDQTDKTKSTTKTKTTKTVTSKSVMTKTVTTDTTKSNSETTEKEASDTGKDVVKNYIIFDPTQASHEDLVLLSEFKRLLGEQQNEKYKITSGLPPNKSIKNDDKATGEIFIQTHSFMQILILLSQCIYESIEKPSDSGEISKRSIMGGIIKSKIPPPKDPFVAIRYRDYWFYIDDNDKDFKNFFSSTALIWAMIEPGGSTESAK